MWQQLYDGLKKMMLIKEQTDKNAADIKEMQRELKELTAVVQRLIYEMQVAQNDEAHERKNLALSLENELLKSERRLPPPT